MLIFYDHLASLIEGGGGNNVKQVTVDMDIVGSQLASIHFQDN